MSEGELEDVAFLPGDNKKRTLLIHHHPGMEGVRPLTCSKGQSLCVTSVVLAVLVAIALIAAFARPFPRCTPFVENGDDDDNNNHDDDDDDQNGPSAVLASTSTQAIPTALTGQVFPWHDIRLPDFIVPVHYSLFMHPNLTKFTNVGSVNITFYVERETEFIVLHSKDLTIGELSVRDEDGDDVQIVQHLEYPPHEQIYIEFKESLDANQNYTIEIDFSKKLEEKLEGLYISSYNTEQGEKRYMATTHFEATSARLAFPCFDEPALKASFELRMVHDQHLEAYFNSEKEEEIPYKDDLVISVFEPTVRMSTYLVAFVVCDFRAVSKISKGGVKVQVLAPLEQLDQAHFALETAVDILDYFHEFFNVAYPLKKLDLIAIPDFGPGAMENWGLIAFRTTAILFNENESSITNKESVATIVAHELAHQWFGNLVTMEWWNDLWLNEGFASFVENLGTHYLKPEWKMMEQFTLVTTQDALALDSLESSHRILADVKNPTEIESIFDAISYKKGSAIIQMLESFLGLEILREGLKVYLNKYRFDNAETSDLWEAFTKVTPASSQLNVSAVMNTWTQQKGFPLLRVTRKVETVTITQERFLLTTPEEDDADEDDISPFGYKWYIPVTYITDGASNSKLYWLNMTDGEFKIPRYTEWLKVNVNQTGFYRVLYDDENWKDLIDALKQNHKAFSATDRASLIDDAMVLARVGKLDTDLAFDLLTYLKKEQDYVPWETALIHLDYLDALMQESPGYPQFKEFVLDLIKAIVDSVGWEDEGTHSERKLRASILSMAVRFGDKETIKVATEMFENWKAHRIHVSPNLRNVVYMAGVHHGQEDDWEFCWEKYMESNVPSEKHLLLTALGNTDNIWQLSQYLDYSLDREKVRPQDVTSVITVAARNPIGRLLTWRFVRAHWDELLAMFGEVSFSLDVIISETVSHFNTKYDFKEVESFFSSVQTGTGTLSVKQSLERIQANIFWNENQEDDFIKWLKDYNDDDDDDDDNGDANEDKDGDGDVDEDDKKIKDNGHKEENDKKDDGDDDDDDDDDGDGDEDDNDGDENGDDKNGNGNDKDTATK